MTNFIKIFVFCSSCFLMGCHHPCQDFKSSLNGAKDYQKQSLEQSSHYSFEGTEPFWQMEIHNDSILLFCDNKEVQMRATFAEKSVNGNTIGFSNDEIYGIINENWEHNCCYSISEKDSLPYEIFFVFEGKTYRGCGEKRHSSLLFSDGESANFINKYMDYTSEKGGFNQRYTTLFEETYHAADYDRGRLDYDNPTCMDEARAWKFATKAPHTKMLYGFFGTTFAGLIAEGTTIQNANLLHDGEVGTDFEGIWHVLRGKNGGGVFENLPLKKKNQKK